MNKCDKIHKASKSKEVRQLSATIAKATNEKNRFLFCYVIAAYENHRHAAELAEYVMKQYSIGKRVKRQDGRGVHSVGGAIIKVIRSSMTPQQRTILNCIQRRGRTANKAAIKRKKRRN